MTNLRTMLRFAALGKGNGALFQLFHLFQLVPLRWPLNAAAAGSMIGKFGVPGGGLVPNAMAFVQAMCGHQGIKVSRYQGIKVWGVVLLAVLAVLVLCRMRRRQIRWTRTWAKLGGRARFVTS